MPLRALGSPAVLRLSYLERDGEWAHALADQRGLGSTCRADLRRIEDAAHGLRWLEVVHGQRFDLSRSLVPQFPLALLDANGRDERPDAREDSTMAEQRGRIGERRGAEQAPRPHGWRCVPSRPPASCPPSAS